MYPKLLDMAKYHGAGCEDAQDAVQDLFIKLLAIQQKEGNLNRLEYNGNINLVYIFNALRGIVNNKRRYDNYRLGNEKLSANRTCEFTLHECEVNDRLKKMDGFSQQLYRAYMEDNISLRELSRRTNISVTTIFYGVKKIRETLKDIFYDTTAQKSLAGDENKVL